MKRRRFLSWLLALVCVLLLAEGVQAMASDHWRLDWFVPLAGSGAPASSAHFAVNLTFGQAAAGVQASEHWQSCLGYWCTPAEWDLFMPVMGKN